MVGYCYIAENGETAELMFPMGDAPPSVVLDSGQRAVRDFRAEGVGGQVAGTKTPCKGWPMAPCVASGVHPDQAGELREHLTRRGCPTEVTGGGNPVYTSAAHRKKALKIRGFCDKN